MASPYGSSTDYLNDTSQFDYARQKAKQQSDVDLQAKKDALQRRFANLGNLDSGAQIKQEQLAQDEVSQNLTNANEGINAQQNQELGRRKEVVQGQQFQSGERQAAQEFAGNQANLQRLYGTSERIAGQSFTAGQNQGNQDFAANQANLQRLYGTNERIAGQSFTAGQNAATRKMQQDQMNEAVKEFNATFGQQVKVDQANIDFNNRVLNQKGPLDKVFGGGINDFWNKVAGTNDSGNAPPLAILAQGAIKSWPWG